MLARWDGVEGKVYYPGTLNIAIAVDTPFGLFVPVIRGVENLSIIEIQKEIVRLSTLAREKKLKMSDMTGGSALLLQTLVVPVYYSVLQLWTKAIQQFQLLVQSLMS
nr:2-oxo acid dehydrogenase subunit E2 [Mycoplasmopsis bovis]